MSLDKFALFVYLGITVCTNIKKNVFKKKLLCCICQFKNSLFGAYKATLQHDFKRQYHITKKVKLIYKIIDLNVKRSFMKGMRIKYRLHLTSIKIL